MICSDKTGTLTENKMKVGKLVLEGREVDLDSASEYPLLVRSCLLNSSADVEFNGTHHNYIGNPTEGALISMINNPSYSRFREEAKVVRQIPFASVNKYMLTAIETKEGYEVLSKGAPEVILNQSAYELVNGQKEYYLVRESRRFRIQSRLINRRLCVSLPLLIWRLHLRILS